MRIAPVGLDHSYQELLVDDTIITDIGNNHTYFISDRYFKIMDTVLLVSLYNLAYKVFLAVSLCEIVFTLRLQLCRRTTGYKTSLVRLVHHALMAYELV